MLEPPAIGQRRHIEAREPLLLPVIVQIAKERRMAAALGLGDRRIGSDQRGAAQGQVQHVGGDGFNRQVQFTRAYLLTPPWQAIRRPSLETVVQVKTEDAVPDRLR